MIKLDDKYKNVLLEALEDLMYKLSIEQESYKGMPMDASRKKLTQKQGLVENLQYEVATYDAKVID